MKFSEMFDKHIYPCYHNKKDSLLYKIAVMKWDLNGGCIGFVDKITPSISITECLKPIGYNWDGFIYMPIARDIKTKVMPYNIATMPHLNSRECQEAGLMGANQTENGKLMFNFKDFEGWLSAVDAAKNREFGICECETHLIDLSDI